MEFEIPNPPSISQLEQVNVPSKITSKFYINPVPNSKILFGLGMVFGLIENFDLLFPSYSTSKKDKLYCLLVSVILHNVGCYIVPGVINFIEFLWMITTRQKKICVYPDFFTKFYIGLLVILGYCFTDSFSKVWADNVMRIKCMEMEACHETYYPLGNILLKQQQKICTTESMEWVTFGFLPQGATEYMKYACGQTIHMTPFLLPFFATILVTFGVTTISKKLE